MNRALSRRPPDHARLARPDHGPGRGRARAVRGGARRMPGARPDGLVQPVPRRARPPQATWAGSPRPACRPRRPSRSLRPPAAPVGEPGQRPPARTRGLRRRGGTLPGVREPGADRPRADGHVPRLAWGRWALGLLDLGLGRPAAALEHLRVLENGPAVHQLAAIRALPRAAGGRGCGPRDRDLAEQGAGPAHPLGGRGEAERRGRPRAARRGPARRGTTSPPPAALPAALRLYEKSDRPFDRARTQLLWGERLRRERRRTEARGPLTAALDTFERLGATPWADRARQELAASGAETGQRRNSERDNAVVTRTNTPAQAALAVLTSQEAQIVRLAAQGLSNRDIAAQLVLSPRTVGHHLYKAYPKLGIVSRGELPRAPRQALTACGSRCAAAPRERAAQLGGVRRSGEHRAPGRRGLPERRS